MNMVLIKRMANEAYGYLRKIVTVSLTILELGFVAVVHHLQPDRSPHPGTWLLFIVFAVSTRGVAVFEGIR